MKEIEGELWDYYGKPDTVICITTNGTLKRNGCGVMGRGCAKELLRRVPDADALLGSHLQAFGNVVGRLFVEPSTYILTFPVKHNWWEKADLQLIIESVKMLHHWAVQYPNTTFLLPRPGCGNGRLQWADVKPLLQSLPDNVLVITHAV